MYRRTSRPMFRGINVEGINAEATGQWEYQIFAKGAKTLVTKSGLQDI